jgi:hypothetical protein
VSRQIRQWPKRNFKLTKRKLVTNKKYFVRKGCELRLSKEAKED